MVEFLRKQSNKALAAVQVHPKRARNIIAGLGLYALIVTLIALS